MAEKLENFLLQKIGSDGSASIRHEIQTFEEFKKTNLTEPSGSIQPSKQEIRSTQYARDAGVKAWVLRASKGRCDLCSQSAPFQRANGMPYLEVHHVKRLVDGGSDTVSNAVALCPNCHRELHHGVDTHTLIDKLFCTISRLKKEPQ